VRRLSRAWLWGTLVWLAAVAPVHAQGVEWQVHAGFEGVCSYDSPVPVLVEFTNNGPARKGQLTIGSRREGHGDDSVRYIVPLDLPENSHKTYSLEVRNPSQRQLILTLNGQSEKRDIRDIREVAAEDVLIVAISENPSLLQFLDRSALAYGGNIAKPAEGAVAIGHTIPGNMPHSWAGWRGVDIAVVAAERLSEASPQEMDALRQWVQLGGSLIVNGGVFGPGMASGPLGEMLPLQVTGTRTVSELRALGAWAGHPLEVQETLIAAGRPAAGARVLCGTPGLPLITTRDVGSGVVAMTAFDLTGRPVKYWDGQEEMWVRLACELDVHRGQRHFDTLSSQDYFPGMTDRYVDSLARTARSHVEPGLPSAGLVMGFLLAYIIVLVPVSYIVLARRDRREWAWITTPIVVLVFTFGAYGIGYLSRGGKTIVDRVALVVAQSGDSAALGSGAVAVFSPGSRKYAFDLEGSVASPSWVGDPGNVIYGPQRKITGFRINKWSCRSLTADFVADLGEGIEAHAILDGRKLTAQVTNNTGLPLRGCRILRGGQEGARVDLAAGASTQMTFDSPTQAGNLDLGAGNDPYSYSGRRASARRRSLFDKHSLADLAVAELAQDDRMQPYGMSPYAGNSNRPYLLAICEEPMLTVDPVRTRARLTDCTIIIVPLVVTISSGNRVSIEDWMVSQNVVVTEGSVATMPRDDRLMSISDGAIILDIQVDTGDKQCRATSLKLQIDSSSDGYSSTPSSPTAPRTQAWSRSRGEWVALNAGPGRPAETLRYSAGDTTSHDYVLGRPGDCMSADGVVRVRLSASDWVHITKIRLTGEIEKNGSGNSSRWTTSGCRSTAATHSDSSGPTGRGRPPRSPCWRHCWSRMREPLRYAGTTSARTRRGCARLWATCRTSSACMRT